MCGTAASPLTAAPPLPTEHLHNMPALKDAATAARWAAMSPGAPIARRFFARHPVVLQVIPYTRALLSAL